MLVLVLVLVLVPGLGTWCWEGQLAPPPAAAVAKLATQESSLLLGQPHDEAPPEPE